MHEEILERGVLTGAAERLPGQGPDPMDAATAAFGARTEAGAAEPPPEKESGAAAAPQEREAFGPGDFSWPEGYAADPEVMARFLPLAQQIGLSKEAAQRLAGFYADLDQERRKAQADFIAENDAEWAREIRSHPEFGGANLRRAGENVAAMLRRHGSPLLTAQIRQMNIQNWPEMFYFLARTARAAAEDASPAGCGGDAATLSTAELLFPGLK